MTSSNFPFPYVDAVQQDSILLGETVFVQGSKLVHLVCHKESPSLDIKISSGAHGYEIREELALAAIHQKGAHFESSPSIDGYTWGGWKALYLNLGKGRKGIVSRQGNKIVQEEYTPSKSKKKPNKKRKVAELSSVQREISKIRKLPDVKREIGKLCSFH